MTINTIQCKRDGKMTKVMREPVKEEEEETI
jgi:hypothetical protein